MDRHTCRLCFRRFHNGRALGGHMRSHVMAAASYSPPLSVSLASTSSTELDDNPPPAPAQPQQQQQKPQPQTPCAAREGTKKRSFHFFDSPGPELSSGDGRGMAAGGESSVLLLVQDGESDTESSSPRFAVSRRRSKRTRRRRAPPPPAMASDPEQPASSVSDATTEEDVAMSLVMLSRDSWTRSSRARSGCWGSATSAAEQNNDDNGADHEQPLRARGGRQHQCDVCRKVFRSYQALGGHRASIKKGKGGCVPLPAPAPSSSSKNKAHRTVVVHHGCPFCFRVFESGQALGGHKRAHMPYAGGGAPATPSPRTPAKCGGDSSGSVTIDLNVPAATDDDFELSAVYDAEFGSARQ